MHGETNNSDTFGHGELRSRGSMYRLSDDIKYGANEKPDDVKKSKQVDNKAQKSSSSSSVLILLLVMVGLTWGIAATAYFGVVDYKALADPVLYVDKRRSVITTLPMRKLTISIQSVQVEKRTSNDDASAAPKNDDDPAVKANTKQDDAPSRPKKDVKDGKVKDHSKKTAGKSTQTKSAAPKTKGTKAGQSKKAKANPYTSEKDQPILDKLNEGDALLKKKKAEEAKEIFRRLTEKHRGSPRARFGLAESLNMLAEQKRSNQFLQDAIAAYDVVSLMPNCPPTLKRKALLTKAERQTFLGHLKAALLTTAKLAKEFPTDVEILNKLGVSYLMTGGDKKAKQIYEEVLKLKPNDGFALTHLGFIVKNEGDWVKGADYLHRGINTREEGTQVGKFYFHLGDALHRTNRTEEAEEIYERGAKAGLFRSKYQRSLYNVDRLQSRPFWTPQQAKVTNYVKKLEQNWKLIRDEAMRIMDVEKGLFLSEEESLRNTGEWRQLTLYMRGKKTPECDRMPKVCALFDSMPNAKGCTRGQIKYSVMMPGTHVWPHTGPTNCRLRMHLGLVIPTTGEGTRLRCADEYKTWQEGKMFIFDDSFEHEVWQMTESLRLILIVDIWHPDLTEREKRTLNPI